MRWFGYDSEPDGLRPPAAALLEDEVPAPFGERCGLGGDEIVPGDRGYMMPMVDEEGTPRLVAVHEYCLIRHVLSPAVTAAVDESVMADLARRVVERSMPDLGDEA